MHVYGKFGGDCHARIRAGKSPSVNGTRPSWLYHRITYMFTFDIRWECHRPYNLRFILVHIRGMRKPTLVTFIPVRVCIYVMWCTRIAIQDHWSREKRSTMEQLRIIHVGNAVDVVCFLNAPARLPFQTVNFRNKDDSYLIALISLRRCATNGRV